jgi:hypothetical protein
MGSRQLGEYGHRPYAIVLKLNLIIFYAPAKKKGIRINEAFFFTHIEI